MVRLLSLCLSLSVAAAGSVQAYFVMGAGHSLGVQRLDPIVAPGGVSSHAHTFVGSNFVRDTVDYSELRARTTGWQQGIEYVEGPAYLRANSTDKSCSTTGVWADASMYWTPQLYWRNDNGTFNSINLSYSRLYYFNRVGDKDRKKRPDALAFPKGLRMLAGSAMKFEQTNTGGDASGGKVSPDSVVSFMCLNYSSGSKQTPLLPDGTCPQGLRLQVTFPSCWNGKDLDSSDHMSHMAYPLGPHIDNGDCPTTHPIKLATMFHEWVYDTGKLPANTGRRYLTLATGDQLGTSFHADFINGWDTDVLQQALVQCEYRNNPNNTDLLYLDAKLWDCPPLRPYIGTPRSRGKVPGTDKCFAPTSVGGEKVMGTGLPWLPGCNPIRNGPNKQLDAEMAPCRLATQSKVTLNGKSLSKKTAKPVASKKKGTSKGKRLSKEAQEFEARNTEELLAERADEE